MAVDSRQEVQSISRAASLLRAISDGLHSMTDIGTKCGLSKSTTHRLLQALISSDLVTQDPVSRQYYLGYTVTRLIGKPEITHEYLVSCAREEIKRLSEYSGETIGFGVMIALKYVNLYSIPSAFNLRAVEEPQKSDLIHTGAHGRVLLSQLSNRDLHTVIKTLQSNPITENSSLDRKTLLDQVELIRKHGYAVSSNERATGVMCAAAPITSYTLPATLYIIGPETRMKPKITELISNLLLAAARISNNVEQVFRTR